MLLLFFGWQHLLGTNEQNYQSEALMRWMLLIARTWSVPCENCTHNFEYRICISNWKIVQKTVITFAARCGSKVSLVAADNNNLHHNRLGSLRQYYILHIPFNHKHKHHTIPGHCAVSPVNVFKYLRLYAINTSTVTFRLWTFFLVLFTRNRGFMALFWYAFSFIRLAVILWRCIIGALIIDIGVSLRMNGRIDSIHDNYRQQKIPYSIWTFACTL